MPTHTYRSSTIYYGSLMPKPSQKGAVFPTPSSVDRERHLHIWTDQSTETAMKSVRTLFWQYFQTLFLNTSLFLYPILSHGTLILWHETLPESSFLKLNFPWHPFKLVHILISSFCGSLCFTERCNYLPRLDNRFNNLLLFLICAAKNKVFKYFLIGEGKPHTISTRISCYIIRFRTGHNT